MGQDGLADLVDLPDEAHWRSKQSWGLPTRGTTGAESWERMFISLLSRRDLERAVILG